MGANLDYRVFKTEDKAAIRREWEAAVDCDRRDNGRSYSGGIGMLGCEIKWHPAPAATVEEAEDVLCERHEKWSGPLAVRVIDGWVVGGWCAE